MLKISFILLLFVSNFDLNAQSVVFNNLYNYIGDTSLHTSGPFIGQEWYNKESFYNALEIEDGSFVGHGQSYNEWVWANNLPHIFQFNLKIDKYGNEIIPIHNDFYHSGQNNTASNAKTLNSFYLAGLKKDSINSNEKSDFYLVKYSNTGIEDWVLIKDNGTREAIQVICVNNETLFVSTAFFPFSLSVAVML